MDSNSATYFINFGHWWQFINFHQFRRPKTTSPLQWFDLRHNLSFRACTCNAKKFGVWIRTRVIRTVPGNIVSLSKTVSTMMYFVIFINFHQFLKIDEITKRTTFSQTNRHLKCSAPIIVAARFINWPVNFPTLRLIRGTGMKLEYFLNGDEIKVFLMVFSSFFHQFSSFFINF